MSRHRFEVITDQLGCIDVDQKYGADFQICSQVVSYASRECTDTVTPNFRERIAKGEVINNACRMEFVRIKQSDGYLRGDNKADDGYFTLTGPIDAYLAPSGPGYVVDQIGDCVGITSASEAKLKALSNIDRSPYEFSEDVFEVRETVRFLRNPLAAIHKLAVSVTRPTTKSARLTAPLRVSKDLADVWTESRFAFTPLVRSCVDAMHAVTLNRAKTLPLRRSCHGFQTVNDELTGSYTGDGKTFECRKTSYSQMKASILYQSTNPLTDWRSTYGLSFKDIPKTIWAIMPLSFMVDRMVDISSAIGGLVNFLDPRIEILAASTTLRDKRSNELVWTHRAETSTHTFSGRGGGYVHEVDIYDRNPWQPSIRDLVPDIDVSGLVADATSIVDLIALILQRIR